MKQLAAALGLVGLLSCATSPKVPNHDYVSNPQQSTSEIRALVAWVKQYPDAIEKAPRLRATMAGGEVAGYTDVYRKKLNGFALSYYDFSRQKDEEYKSDGIISSEDRFEIIVSTKGALEKWVDVGLDGYSPQSPSTPPYLSDYIIMEGMLRRHSVIEGRKWYAYEAPAEEIRTVNEKYMNLIRRIDIMKEVKTP